MQLPGPDRSSGVRPLGGATREETSSVRDERLTLCFSCPRQRFLTWFSLIHDEASSKFINSHVL